MSWFRPTTGAITQLSEVCMALALLLYLLRFRNKTRDTYLIILGVVVSSLSLFTAFLYDANINSTSYALLEEIANISTRAVFLFVFLLTAYVFGSNPFPREAKLVLSIYVLLSFGSAYFWFRDYVPNRLPSAGNVLFALSIYIFTTLMSAIVLLRKIKALPAHAGSASRSLFPQLFHTSSREAKAYRGFAIVGFIYTTLWICFLLTLVGLISWSAWNYISYALVFFLITFYILTYYNYASEATSLQAKLVGTILFIVLGILGALPMILFGDTRFVPAPPAEQEKIDAFVIILPVTTVLIAVVLPFVIRRVILNHLNDVLAAVRRVNAGDLSTNLRVDTSDEMGVLSNNFNQMTASLQQYADKMNDLVEERTAALNESLQELKSAQAQLIQSEKMASLGELTAGIAHEIQNPLNFVNNFSEVNNELIDEMNAETDVDEIKAIAKDIRQNNEKIAFHGRRADAIVKGMLQHSRQSKGVKELTDLNALCDEYLRLSYHGLRAKDKGFNADYKTHFDESIGSINIVPQDIGRVLLNLFNNAFYAVSEKKKLSAGGYQPSVSVTTKRISDGIEIKVSDNGNGIPQSVIDKIFQPFFTTKPTGQGTGLGLSLSYDIITKEHNGTIQVESKEGEGSLFIISLPV